MSMLYVLIPLALVLLVFAAWAFLWAIRSGQFDDLDSQGWSVVLDEDQIISSGENPAPTRPPGSVDQD